MAFFVTTRCQEFVFDTCPECKTVHGFPRFIYDAARARRGPRGLQVYCPNGHSWHYVEGESEIDKLRRERDGLKQRQAWYEDQLRAESEERERAQRQAAARKGQITKLKKRTSAGVCPCCNRSFENLRRHMESQHPKFTAEAVD